MCDMEEAKDIQAQTLIGKILGWLFGVLLCLSIFSVFDKEIGAFGLIIALIGFFLLPPVNMHFRKKYHNFVKKYHGEKYGTNIINFGYTGIKITITIILLILFAAFSTPKSETSLEQSAQKPQNSAQEVKPAKEQKQGKPKVSFEYKNALIKAESYSQTMNMSKRAIYDQLVSEYGEQFPADAAQYAIDNLKADFNANALAKAKDYQQTMNMSKKAIYDQLISDYGEKFTAQEAQYAIDHLAN